MHTTFDAELRTFMWQHMWRGALFSGSITLHPIGRGPSPRQFWGLLSIYAYIFVAKTTKFDVVTHIGRACFRGQQRPHCTVAWSSARMPVWGFPSIFVFTLCGRSTKCDVVIKHVGRGVYLGVSHASHPKKSGVMAPLFWGSTRTF